MQRLAKGIGCRASGEPFGTRISGIEGVEFRVKPASKPETVAGSRLLVSGLQVELASLSESSLLASAYLSHSRFSD